MTDRLTPEARSDHMRRIRKVDTRPEVAVRKITHALGYRFRLYRRDLPGCPDLAFPKLRKVILVHGCFWHQHKGCRLARRPKSRLAYWLPKLDRNHERDKATLAGLEAAGWEPLVVWECEVADAGLLREKLEDFLSGPPGGRARS